MPARIPAAKSMPNGSVQVLSASSWKSSVKRTEAGCDMGVEYHGTGGTESEAVRIVSYMYCSHHVS
jgi:hypothetical protein